MENWEIFLSCFIICLVLDLIKKRCIAFKHVFTFSKGDSIVRVIIISPYKLQGKLMLNLMMLDVRNKIRESGGNPEEYDLEDITSSYTLHFH